MKLVITGINGFIGKNLVNYYKNKSYDLYPLDHSHLDLLDYDQIVKIFSNINPDIVINCACIICKHNNKNTSNEIDVLHNNIQMINNLLKASSNFNVKKIIFFSTYRVFGNNIHSNYSENDIHSTSLDDFNIGYLFSKRVLDIQIKLYQKYTTMHITNIILTNVFGQCDQFTVDSKIIPSIIKKMHNCKLNNLDLHIDANSQTIFNLVYIDDVVKFVDIIISNNQIKNNIFFFNSTGIYTLEQITGIISKSMKFDNSVYYSDANNQISSNIMKPDLNKFKLFFPNFTFTDIDSSLNYTVQYYLNNI